MILTFFEINESVFGLSLVNILCTELLHYFKFMDFWIEILFRYIDLLWAIRLCIKKLYTYCGLFRENFYFAHHVSWYNESHGLMCTVNQNVFSWGLKFNYTINWKINYNAGNLVINPEVYYYCYFLKVHIVFVIWHHNDSILNFNKYIYLIWQNLLKMCIWYCTIF